MLPDVMTGDGGNAVVPRRRLLLRGIAAEIVEITRRSSARIRWTSTLGRSGGLRAAAGHPAPTSISGLQRAAGRMLK